MNSSKFLRTGALALLAACTLSPFTGETPSRQVACVPDDGAISGGPLPLSSELFGEVQDEARRANTLDWYNYLSQVEAQDLTARARVQAAYGIKTPVLGNIEAFPAPSIPAFPLAPSFSAVSSPLSLNFPGMPATPLTGVPSMGGGYPLVGSVPAYPGSVVPGTVGSLLAGTPPPPAAYVIGARTGLNQITFTGNLLRPSTF